MSSSTIPQKARAVFDEEIEALRLTRAAIGEDFARAAKLIFGARGKVVVSGVGKSGLVGQKIAATLSSTGTTAVFMHAAEGIHGDLGMISKHDVVLALSFSGSTIEILSNLPTIKRIGAKIIAMVGDPASPLAKAADVVLPVAIRREACPMNLAPSSSTAAMMALGDALALVLTDMRRFRPEDFALYHPGGALGRRLLLKVSNLMHPMKELPLAIPATPLAEIVDMLTRSSLGAINIVRSARDRRLAGIITDGDIRRALNRREEFFSLRARDIMTPRPITVRGEMSAAEALELMENRKSQISVLPVVDAKGRALGLVRVHDLLQIGPRA